MVAKHCGMVPGVFTHVIENAQIYDRHVDDVKQLIKREPITCSPSFELKTEKSNFFDFTIDDFVLSDYPREEISRKNPQIKFDLGI